MDDSWDYDCPQFVDFNAQESLDERSDIDYFTDAARQKEKCQEINDPPQVKQESGSVPKNLCVTVSTFQNGQSSSSDNKSVEKRARVKPLKQPTGSLRNRTSSNTDARVTRSVKRSHSFSSVKSEDRAEGSSPARKLIKRSNGVKAIPGSKPLQRTSSTSDLSSRGALKRSSSNSTLSKAKDARTARQSRLKRTGSAGQLRTKMPCTANDSSDTSEKSNKCPPTKMFLTFPSSPSLLRRLRERRTENQAKTSEELEIEQTEQMRKAMHEKLKKNQKGYKKALAVKVLPPQQKITTTAVQEFNFQTDTRIKSEKVDSGGDMKDFVHSLRCNSPAKQKTKIPAGGRTMIKPFNLTESRKMGNPGETFSAKFRSMAESVKAFHARTPDRFRTKAKDTGPITRSKSPVAPSCTIPHTPLFETRSRSRPTTAPSQQELEEMELEEIQKNQFKAHPVNPKIFSRPGIGLKKVEKKPVTQIEGFNLTADCKVKVKNTQAKEETETEFKARPVPTKILEGVVGLKPAKKIKPTDARSPALSVKLRARIPRATVEPEEEPAPVLRRAVPHTGVPFQPQLAHKHVTVEPFQFEEREKERKAKKEEKLKQYLEEEAKAHIFHANPLPESVITGEVILPPKHCKPATTVQPFDLELDKRGKKRQEEFQRKIEEQRQHEKEMTVFKAQDKSVIYKEPFFPKKSERHLADITEFKLNTERRAEEREAFEQSRKMRRAEENAYTEREEQRKLEEEKEAIAHMRQEMVHRANPIRQYKQVEKLIEPAAATIPMSPVFHTDRRLRSAIHKHDTSS